MSNKTVQAAFDAVISRIAALEGVVEANTLTDVPTDHDKKKFAAMVDLVAAVEPPEGETSSTSPDDAAATPPDDDPASPPDDAAATPPDDDPASPPDDAAEPIMSTSIETLEAFLPAASFDREAGPRGTDYEIYWVTLADLDHPYLNASHTLTINVVAIEGDAFVYRDDGLGSGPDAPKSLSVGRQNITFNVSRDDRVHAVRVGFRGKIEIDVLLLNFTPIDLELRPYVPDPEPDTRPVSPPSPDAITLQEYVEANPDQNVIRKVRSTFVIDPSRGTSSPYAPYEVVINVTRLSSLGSNEYVSYDGRGVNRLNFIVGVNTIITDTTIDIAAASEDVQFDSITIKGEDGRYPATFYPNP